MYNRPAQANLLALNHLQFGNPILLDPASKGFSMVSEYLLENRANPNDTTKVSPVLQLADFDLNTFGLASFTCIIHCM